MSTDDLGCFPIIVFFLLFSLTMDSCSVDRRLESQERRIDRLQSQIDRVEVRCR